MDFKKVIAAPNTQTRDLGQYEEKAGNIYSAINILAQRANQISKDIKDELNRKLDDFKPQQDNLEEIFDNREQIEISKFYERLPKPTAIAIKEMEDDKLIITVPSQDDEELQ